MEFCHLHTHNEYSLLDGIGTAEQQAEKASSLGHKYLALTNHGNVDGSIKFQSACLSKNIIPVHGCEAYLVPDINIKEKGEKKKHINILVSNSRGWSNLLKMLSIANTEGFYYKPRLSPDIFLKNCEGLVVLTACSSTFIAEDWGINFLLELKNIIPVFLEIMPFNFKDQIKTNLLALDLHKQYGIELVATNDSHYINKEDSTIQEVLLAMQTKKRWTDKDRWKFEVDGLYLRSATEMIKSFKEQNCLAPSVYRKAMENTIKVAELCKDFKIEKQEVILPLPPRIKEKDPNIFIKELCLTKLESFSDKLDYDAYKKRYEEEIEIIIKQNFSIYFLIIWDLVKWCRENDIMVGPGRGSSGGSLVCYLLGITTVDPIKFKLVFARFISPARIDLPDIDMDFEDIKRPLIRKYLEDTYGKYCVAGVSTFGAMKGRGALRDVSRVFSVPLVDVNKASSCIVVRSGGDFRSDYTIEDAFNTFEDGKKFKQKYPDVVNIACKVEGQVKSKGMHAAAIIITAEDIREGKRANYVYGKDKTLMVNWEKTDIEYVGLMKLDVLGLNALTVLNNCKDLIKKNHNTDIVYEKIPLDDSKVFEEFTKGHNVGCFQVGSLGLRKFCQQIGVDDFMMLVHASSLYRPGTLRSGMTTEFVARKKKEKTWQYKHPFIKKITEDTFGVILYQEQVMAFMYELGGLGWKTADTVRKVISKSQGVEQFNKFKDLFAEGCVKNKTLTKKEAEELWNELASFGSYGFNLSHAVEYSYITYWDQWLKVYYPQEFMCASLSYGSEIKKDELIEEAIRLGIDVRPPKVGISKAKDWILVDNKLYCPFIDIKGFGEKTAKYAEELNKSTKSESSGKSSGKGFYPSDTKEKTKLTARFLKILKEINSFEDREITEEECDLISKYFQFSFSRDRSKKFRKIKEVLSAGINFSEIKNCKLGTIDKEYKFYFGQMTEIKYGYRGKIDTLEKKLGVSGVAGSLGGVYGNFKDNEDFAMLVFGSDIYKNKKDCVEHCAEEFLMVKTNQPSRTGSLQCADAWFAEEILAGELNGLNLQLAQKKRFRNKDLLMCNKCDLNKTKILPSVGRYNILILCESPAREDIKNGSFLSDSAGDLLWKELKKYDLNKELFHITGIIKCQGEDSKVSLNKQIRNCSSWLEEEIAKIKPFLILAIGNASLNFLKGEETGIMAKNGTTEWIEKIGSWVCWCINPSAALYHRENMPLLQKSIENFSEKIKILGGL